MRRSFASDNNAPVAPEIMQAIIDANAGDAIGYGEDAWTERAKERFKEQFGEQTQVFFTFNGTGANVAALSSVLHPWEAVVAAASAHLQTDECGALERFSGSKVIRYSGQGWEAAAGRYRDASACRTRRPFPAGARHFDLASHRVWRRLEIEELRELCSFAHERGLIVHVDGARLANAAVALGAKLRDTTVEAGVDVLSFGGTKNGLMLGEAMCFFKSNIDAGAAPFVQKQSMQLGSKMRYLGAQLGALLTDERWSHYAAHANSMAARLYDRVRAIPGIRVTRPVRCNSVFVTLDRTAMEKIRRQYFFYLFDESLPEVRWMTHWATTAQDVDEFADCVERAV